MTERVLVTGGASGLGKAIVESYAERKAKIAILDVNEADGNQFLHKLKSRGIEALFYKLDVRNESDFKTIAENIQEQWGGLDLLINNAGVGGTVGSIDEVSAEDWQWVMDINLQGVVNGCRVFTPMLRQSKGAIVNVASAAGLMNAPLMSSYNVSKAAVISLSETLRIELAHAGIQVHVLCPSFFSTNLTQSMKSHVEGMHERVNKIMERSGISAEQVVEAMHDALMKNRFMVITHASERKFWRIKRFMPNLFRKLMIKQTQKLFGKKARS